MRWCDLVKRVHDQVLVSVISLIPTCVSPTRVRSCEFDNSILKTQVTFVVFITTLWLNEGRVPKLAPPGHKFNTELPLVILLLLFLFLSLEIAIHCFMVPLCRNDCRPSFNRVRAEALCWLQSCSMDVTIHCVSRFVTGRTSVHVPAWK